MNKQNFLTLTLIISGLALSPVIADSEFNRISQSQNIKHSVAASISSILYNRGIDEDVADEMASDLVNEEDEQFLHMMIQTLEMHNIVSEVEVLEYLSRAALHKQTLNFYSYDHLIGMVSKIKQTALDERTLAHLNIMAKQNNFILG